MEAEMDFEISRTADIKFKHPQLRSKYNQIFTKLYREYKYIYRFEGPSPGDEYLARLLDNGLTWEDIHDFVQQRNEIRSHELDLIGKKMEYTRIDIIKNAAARYTIKSTPIKEIKCTCKGEDQMTLFRLLPVGENGERVQCFNTCDRTLYAAFCRQLKAVTPPDPKIIKDFIAFSKQFIDEHLKPKLVDFDYSYNFWFTHNPADRKSVV